jgi:hypothetical protein
MKVIPYNIIIATKKVLLNVNIVHSRAVYGNAQTIATHEYHVGSNECIGCPRHFGTQQIIAFCPRLHVSLPQGLHFALLPNQKNQAEELTS